MIYFVGQDVALNATVVDHNGAPVAATTITVTVTAPDGTTSTPTPASTGVGTYQAIVPAVALAGGYQALWHAVVSGGNAVFAGRDSQFTVRSAAAIPLADPDDLAARLGVSFTATQYDRAVALLADASAIVRNYCRQKFTYATDSAVLESTSEEWLYLPERPVISIASVTAGGALLASGYWTLQNDALFRYGGWNSRFYGAASPWNQPNTIVVQYTHGYNMIPEDVIGVVCKLSQLSWVNPGFLTRYQLGSLNVQSAPESVGAGALDDGDKRILDYYRRPRRSATLSANLL